MKWEREILGFCFWAFKWQSRNSISSGGNQLLGTCSSSRRARESERGKGYPFENVEICRQQEFLGFILQRSCPRKVSVVFGATFLIQAFAELNVSSGAWEVDWSRWKTQRLGSHVMLRRRRLEKSSAFSWGPNWLHWENRGEPGGGQFSQWPQLWNEIICSQPT